MLKINKDTKIDPKTEWIERFKEIFGENNSNEDFDYKDFGKPKEEITSLVADIASKTIGFSMDYGIKAMSDEEYDEWSKDHQVITKDGHTIVSGDKIKLSEDGKTIIHITEEDDTEK